MEIDKFIYQSHLVAFFTGHLKVTLENCLNFRSIEFNKNLPPKPEAILQPLTVLSIRCVPDLIVPPSDVPICILIFSIKKKYVDNFLASSL
jgi:hypothetical protein